MYPPNGGGSLGCHDRISGRRSRIRLGRNLMPDLVPLPGSERSEIKGAAPASTPLNSNQVITVTVLLRRRAEVPTELVQGPETITTSELGEQYGADPADAQLVAEVLGSYGVAGGESHP